MGIPGVGERFTGTVGSPSFASIPHETREKADALLDHPRSQRFPQQVGLCLPACLL
ncbi:MAG: hypothetical protein ACYDCC_05315 [Actinomycetota bacterium]